MHQVDARGAAAMDRYLLDDEVLVAAVHQHWARLSGVVVCSVVGFVLVVAIGLLTPASLGALSNAAWWIWFALLAYTGAIYWQWRREWFVATDRRLLLTYGVLTHKVAMMPMHKVTDMSFNRSLAGRVLGYGSFVMESAGQDQAMHRIDYIPRPDETYRSICDQIFGDRVDVDDMVPVDLETEEQRAFDDEVTHHDDAEPVYAGHPRRVHADDDPTNVPVRRYGAYLPPPEAKRSTRLRHRILRRPRPSGDKPLHYYESDQGWTVSNEDASAPQPVSRRYRGQPDDEA